jgi:hypothetical protein
LQTEEENKEVKEAIAVPDSQRRSVADSIDFHSIGTWTF